MARIGHIRGMLLEEVLLHLLRGTGYRTVENVRGDPTLSQGHSGVEVLGRGGKHQIDAIADFRIPHPFSHAQRLLVEAKCYSGRKPVGIEVARNAVGVLKDVNEYWASAAPAAIAKHRYHYQYGLFSATPYSNDAQRYAFAHDIYLIPVGNSTHLTSIVAAIRALSATDFGYSPTEKIDISVSELRHAVRRSLRSRQPLQSPHYPQTVRGNLVSLIQLTFAIDYALLAVIGGSLPVFLVPRNEQAVQSLPDFVNVRIWWDDRSWYLDGLNDERLFSFDLPTELFELYAEAGVLTPEQALNLKEDAMNSFYAFRTINNQVRVIRFELDRRWLQTVRERLRTGRASTPRRGGGL